MPEYYLKYCSCCSISLWYLWPSNYLANKERWRSHLASCCKVIEIIRDARSFMLPVALRTSARSQPQCYVGRTVCCRTLWCISRKFISKSLSGGWRCGSKQHQPALVDSYRLSLIFLLLFCFFFVFLYCKNKSCHLWPTFFTRCYHRLFSDKYSLTELHRFLC